MMVTHVKYFLHNLITYKFDFMTKKVLCQTNFLFLTRESKICLYDYLSVMGYRYKQIK